MDARPGPRAAGDRARLASLIAGARWIGIALGLAEAFLSRPAPISRAGLLAALVVLTAVNLPASRPRRLSEGGLNRLLLVGLCLDFAVTSAAVALTANQPVDDLSLLWALVGLEAAALFGLRGAIVFSVVFGAAFSGWVAEARLAYASPAPGTSHAVAALTVILVSLIGGGLAATSERLAREALDEADRARRLATDLARVRAEADRQAEENHEQLSTFLHTLVHDLRSPLTVIAGYADMLRLEDFFTDTRSRRTALDAVVAKSEALNDVIEGLLVAARIGEARGQPEPQTIDLAEAVDRALSRIHSSAARSDASITVSSGRPSPAAAANPHAVDRILDNLLINAITYGGRQPRIEIEIGVDAAAWVRIRDHGVGVVDAMRERIFDRFVRVTDPAHLRGTGLGLFVARGLAQEQHGDVVLEWTQPGEGSLFALRLPVAAPRAGVPSEPPS